MALYSVALLSVALLAGANPCGLQFQKVHERRFQLDGIKPLSPDVFWPGAQYVADVRDLPATVGFVSADGRWRFRYELQKGDARLPPLPFELAVLVSGRSSVAFFTRKNGDVRLLGLVSPDSEPGFDMRSRKNLSDLRFRTQGGAAHPRVALSAGIGQADIRFVTEGRTNVPYRRNGRLFFTFSARAYGCWLGVMSIDPCNPSDLRTEGTIFFDTGDGLIRNDVAADLFHDETDGLWKAYVSNFSTGADAGAGTQGRAAGGINVAWSEECPLEGVHVMKARSLGLSGMNEDPDGFWDAEAGKWRLLVSEFTSAGIRASMLESDNWDGPFVRLTSPVDVDSTGTAVLPFGSGRYCLFGSARRMFAVRSYPTLEPIGELQLDHPPWEGKQGWPHGRSWPAVAEFWKDGRPAYLLVTMDRENFPGMPTPNWTYGKLMVYVADGARLSRKDVKVGLLNGAVCQPDSFVVRTSLEGTWRFKGLDRQDRPFGQITESERQMMDAGLDESAWTTIQVPLNWWADGRFSYEKMFDPKSRYFRGYYRRRVSIAEPRDGRRRILRFEEVGAEFDLFVNGRHVFHHLGDFTPTEVDITDALKPGDNLLALRVLSDFGPVKGHPYTRVYGARWSHRDVKGGIWHSVSLLETPPIRMAEMLIDPEKDCAHVDVRCRIDSSVAASDLTLAASLVEDVSCAPPGMPVVRRSVSLRRGTQEISIRVPASNVKRWSPDTPNLYWLVLTLEDESGNLVSSTLERFGFRSMRTDGARFRLNDQPVYLVGDSLHSMRYGGRGDDCVARIRADLLRYKRGGANLLRTAHQPALPEVYDLADEIGMMIYDEWGNAFCNVIEEAAFERNNLPELVRWVRRDYNHPSVVLWSLGNEIHHGKKEDVCRQLDKQYDLVKSMDLHERPICAFSGNADVWNYGTERIKTDFLDTHRYLGIDKSSWTTWFKVAEDWYPQLLDIYGNGGKLTMPLVMWECVGAGWGLHRDDEMKDGDVKRYLEWASKPCTWAGAEGVGYSATVGLIPMLHHHRHYVQGYLADRLCELFVQDCRLAGFAPWFADASVPGLARRCQRVYPLLRNNARSDGRLMYRQLTSPGARQVECAVVNHSACAVRGARVRVSVVAKGRECEVGSCQLPDIPPFEERCAAFELPIPAGLSGRGEIRLALEGETPPGTNAYDVTFHDGNSAERSLVVGSQVALSACSPVVERLLSELKVPVRTLGCGDRPSAGSVLVVPPEGSSLSDRDLASFVSDGGTMLVLEPDGLTVPGFPMLRLIEASNHLVEPVVSKHPVFEGLIAADFDTWAENPLGFVIEKGFAPLTDGVLAAKGRYIADAPFAGAVAEHAFGRGRVLVSCVNAIAACGENPAARRLLRNLLAYAVDPAVQVPHSRIPQLDGLVTRPIPANLNKRPLVIVSPDKPVHIDFSASAGRKTAPWKILFFRDKVSDLASGGFRYLTMTYRSKDRGLVDLTIPNENHSERLTCTFPTSLSDGDSVTVRLDLRRDFRFANGSSFDLSKARGEIIFYNGYEDVLGESRPSVSFAVEELKFE